MQNNILITSFIRYEFFTFVDECIAFGYRCEAFTITFSQLTIGSQLLMSKAEFDSNETVIYVSGKQRFEMFSKNLVSVQRFRICAINRP